MKEDALQRAGARPKGLRESYDGPIDQDGNPASTGRAAEILAALRETTRGERDV